MGYVADQKSQIHSEFGLMIPRLKAFAVAITGCEAKAQMLVRDTRHYLVTRSAKERGHTPLALWVFMQMFRIWAGRHKGKGADKVDPGLFQPRSRANDGGASARMAIQISRLGPLQRGALHLVYGERFSYDEVAEIFGIEMSEVITLLARSYGALGGKAPSSQTASSGEARAQTGGGRPAYDRQGRAA